MPLKTAGCEGNEPPSSAPKPMNGVGVRADGQQPHGENPDAVRSGAASANIAASVGLSQLNLDEHGIELKAPATESHFSFLLPAVDADEIGRLGMYRVLRLLGKGGMGYVFLAEDIALRRRVALKVMKPDLESDPSAWQRFLREARTLAAIKHEHLVTVYQAAQENRVIFLAMEWLQGESIEEWIAAAGAANPTDVIRIGKEIATGLEAIHQHGVVHRDLKPGNLWLEKPNGHIKILDFGLARPMEDDANFTKSGMIVGTPAFMSPEQARGDRIDARSDLFSLGGVLYFMATGVRPFQADNTIALLTALAICDPRPPHEIGPALPHSLSGLIMRLLDKNPDRRPASARDVIAELNRIEVDPTARPAPLLTLPVPAPQTEELDFSTFDMQSEVSARSTKTLQRARSTGAGSFKWGLAIGGVSVVVAGLSIALVAALNGGGSPSPSTAAQTNQPRDSAKAQHVKEKNKNIPVTTAKAEPTYLMDLGGQKSENWVDSVPQNKDKDDPPFGKGKKGPKKDKDGPRPMGTTEVRVNDVPSPKGIFHHPPLTPSGGATQIRFTLKKEYERFQADVSLNDGPPSSETPLTFIVYGDNNELWRSRPVQSQKDKQPCDVSVANVQVLTLEVSCPDMPVAAHGVWIEPRLTHK